MVIEAMKLVKPRPMMVVRSSSGKAIVEWTSVKVRSSVRRFCLYISNLLIASVINSHQRSVRHHDDEIDEVFRLWHNHRWIQSGAAAPAQAGAARPEYLRGAVRHRAQLKQQVTEVGDLETRGRVLDILIGDCVFLKPEPKRSQTLINLHRILFRWALLSISEGEETDTVRAKRSRI